MSLPKSHPLRRTFPERRLRPELDRVRTSLMRLPCGFLLTPQREPGGRGRIRTFVARKERQIYSLLVLATHPPVPQIHSGCGNRIPRNFWDAYHESRSVLPLLAGVSCKNTNWTRVKRHQPVYFCIQDSLRLTPLEISWWSWRRELNPRPSDYKSDALPAELRQRRSNRIRIAEGAQKLQGLVPRFRACRWPVMWKTARPGNRLDTLYPACHLQYTINLPISAHQESTGSEDFCRHAEKSLIFRAVCRPPMGQLRIQVPYCPMVRKP